MNEFLYLISGALVALAFFFAGYFFGRRGAVMDEKTSFLSKQERERILRQRRTLEEEQEAFSMLIGYNPSVAYGMTDGYFDYSRKE